MLRWRLTSAAVMITIAVLAVWLDSRSVSMPGLWLMPIGLLVVALAADEVQHLLGLAQTIVQRGVVCALAVLLFAITALPIWYGAFIGLYPEDCPVGRAGWLGIGVVVASLLWFLHELFWFRPDDQGRANRIAQTIFVLVYPSSLLATAVLIRQSGTHEFGIAIIVAVIAVTKISDSGAYFGGKTMGKHAMAKFLSPKKTWEGAAAGLAAGLAASWIFFAYIAPACFETQPIRGTHIWRSLVFGFVLIVAGMAGDLFESLLKRDAGEKDSSSWVPGLGGILDTIDSLLLAFPAAYLMGIADWTGTAGQ